jgi:hypothetical protein
MISIKTAHLESADPSIMVPDEVHLLDDGRVVACHAETGDVEYSSLLQLESDYLLSIDVNKGVEVAS